MKSSSLFVAGFIFLWMACFNGCSKDPIDPIKTAPSGPPVITQSFTQEFDSSLSTLEPKGWAFKDRSNPSNGGWVQENHVEKIDWGPSLYPAYSGIGHEFAYAGFPQQPVVVSTWMFTPPVKLKNGDKFSFFTKCDSTSINRLEVRLNETDTTSNIGSQAYETGNFTKLVLSINPSSTANGYPTAWTRFEYTVTGLQDPITSRIAFRYYLTNPTPYGAIGIDMFKYEKL
jgi:hypothetical protein